MDTHAVMVRELDKRYSGRRGVHALKGVTLEVARGEIFGLLGQNGAGKTTMVKILLDIVRPTSGVAELLGEPVGRPESRRQLGYLPEDHRFPEYQTAVGAMNFYGRLSKMSGPERAERIPKLLDLVGLTDAADRKVRGYSKGMKQRLGLAQAMIASPKVLFLDEPTDGVDPVGRKEIRAVLHQIKEQGVTIFLNSHLLSEVEQLCDRVAILQHGELLRTGTVQELTRGDGIVFSITADRVLDPTILASMERLGLSLTAQGPHVDVRVSAETEVDRVVDTLRAAGYGLRELKLEKHSLEDVFVSSVEHERGKNS